MSDDRLPDSAHPVLREVADLCGDAVAVNLVRHYAGQRLLVPKKLTNEHHLVQSLGTAQANALVQGYCGERISVPRTLASGAAGRKELVLRSARQNVPVRQIAAQAECTEVRVYQILAEERARTGRDPRKGARKK